jgi:predicted O-linked N-acetylglucosamine transferase (SPINDLY family)
MDVRTNPVASTRWAAPLWLFLGRWLERRQLASVAESAYRQAADGGSRDAAYRLGKRWLDAGRAADALPQLERALALGSNEPRLYLAVGAAKRYMGELEGACVAFQRALTLDPGYAPARNNLGELALVQGRAAEALAHFESALKLAPDLMAAHSNRVAALFELANYTTALASAEEALECFPEEPSLWVNYGNVQLHSGKARPAVKAFQRALELDPSCAEAHLNLATLFGETSHLREAVEFLEQEILLKGETVQRLGALALAKSARKDIEGAARTCDKVLAMQPAHVSALITMGSCRATVGDHRGALEYYQRALAINAEMPAIHSNMAFEATYLEDATSADIFTFHQAWSRQHEQPLAASRYHHVPPENSPQRLKIAYVSGDFGNHPVGFLLRDVIARHDRSHFEVHCFSMMRQDDDITVAIRNCVEHWHDVLLDSDEEVAKRIHAEGIHLLVDLSGHTAYNRLAAFARKPAPVSVTWIGYFHSTGLESIDYFITDPYTSPRGCDQHYSEIPVWLPHSRFCFSPPSYASDVSPLPARESGYLTFGCFNRLDKLSEPVIAAWARILQRVPQSRLLLKAAGLSDEKVAAKLLARFLNHGISNDRLELRGPSSHEEMLAEYGDMDIALDPFPFNGGMTTLEALWMGVPVVTLAGSGIVSRQSVSMLTNLGLEERLAFANIETYVAGAVALAKDVEALEQLRMRIRPLLRASPLCRPDEFTRDLEVLYQRMWQAYCHGERLASDV